jgi:Type I restriction modification DNA specificity domain.
VIPLAIISIKCTSALDEGLILTPERYHPGRLLTIKKSTSGIYLGDLVNITSKTISPKAIEKNNQSVYVLDTGDVFEGRIRGDKDIAYSIKSQKKIIQAEDVIISRLRPYLRQVGFVDKTLIEKFHPDTIFCCSTEFYVLSPKKSESIAFLVPYLLSDSIHRILCNSVEGSQHPRFNEEVLLSLIIPETILKKREHLSKQVIEAIKRYRDYEETIYDSIKNVNYSLEEILV